MPEIQEILLRLWTDLMQRPSGPFAFRFLLQPLVAMLLAARDGIGDARAGRSPYFRTVVTDAATRRAKLGEGLKATARVISLGIVVDAAYQLMAHGTFYPGEALGIALLLGFIPYLLIRGPVDRVARRWLAARMRSTRPVKPDRRRPIA